MKRGEEGKTKAVLLPAELYDRVAERVEVTEFNSVEEYVTFVLEEILRDEEEEKTVFSEEEEEEVKKRLRALGYLE